jgi:hypothetical protein
MSTLETVRLILLAAHVMGLAAVIGPFFFQAHRRSGFQLGTMLTGAVVQLVTGAALVAVRRAEDLAVIGSKIGVKSGIALLVAAVLIAAVIVKRRRAAAGADDAAVRPFVIAAGVAAMLNVVVAIFWR